LLYPLSSFRSLLIALPSSIPRPAPQCPFRSEVYSPGSTVATAAPVFLPSALRCHTSKILRFPSASIRYFQPRTKMEGRRGRPRYGDGHHSSDMVVAKDEVPGAKRSAPPYHPATASSRRRVTFCLQLRKRVPSTSLSQKCTSDAPERGSRTRARDSSTEPGMHTIHLTTRTRTVRVVRMGVPSRQHTLSQTKEKAQCWQHRARYGGTCAVA
jgi:hypothetical protein